jgi:agmatinase
MTPQHPLEGIPSLPYTFAGVSGPLADLETAAVAVLPVPYDSTASYRGGARDGPQAIINASRFLELYEPDLDAEPAEWGIATLPEMEADIASPERTLERVSTVVGRLADMGKLVVMLGGEHSLTVGAVRAFSQRHGNLSVLQIDAHADMREGYMGSPYSHASTMRRVRELSPIAVQAGVRAVSREETEHMRRHGIHVPIYAQGSLTDERAVQELIAPLTDTVYITIDLDALDPAVMPAVGTPEPGGLQWEEILGLLRAVARKSRIVGFDVVELAPAEGPNHAAFTAARLTYRLIGYALATGPGARGR